MKSRSVLTNGLATHLTTWKIWYALLAVPALIVGSTMAVLVQSPGAEDGGTAAPSTAAALMMPLQFIVFGFGALALIALVAKKWPSVEDLALKPRITWRELALLAVVFVVSHAIFWLLEQGGPSAEEQARKYYEEMKLDSGLVVAFAALFTSVILAPVCEELLYRGAMLRPIHDWLASRGAIWPAALLSILVSAAAFAMPHLGGSLFGREAAAYLVTGIAFGLVYVVTGSMTAAMVSHSLQSCFAFGQVLIFGAPGPVSPILYVLVFGCPLWVYLCARGLYAVFPKDGRTAPAAG